MAFAPHRGLLRPSYRRACTAAPPRHHRQQLPSVDARTRPAARRTLSSPPLDLGPIFPNLKDVRLRAFERWAPDRTYSRDLVRLCRGAASRHELCYGSADDPWGAYLTKSFNSRPFDRSTGASTIRIFSPRAASTASQHSLHGGCYDGTQTAAAAVWPRKLHTCQVDRRTAWLVRWAAIATGRSRHGGVSPPVRWLSGPHLSQSAKRVDVTCLSRNRAARLRPCAPRDRHDVVIAWGEHMGRRSPTMGIPATAAPPKRWPGDYRARSSALAHHTERSHRQQLRP